MLRFRDLRASFSSASFSRFRCFVFEFCVFRFRGLGASCFGLRFRNSLPSAEEREAGPLLLEFNLRQDTF